jgi:hypothetical protein
LKFLRGKEKADTIVQEGKGKKEKGERKKKKEKRKEKERDRSWSRLLYVPLM